MKTDNLHCEWCGRRMRSVLHMPLGLPPITQDWMTDSKGNVVAQVGDVMTDDDDVCSECANVFWAECETLYAKDDDHQTTSTR